MGTRDAAAYNATVGKRLRLLQNWANQVMRRKLGVAAGDPRLPEVISYGLHAKRGVFHVHLVVGVRHPAQMAYLDAFIALLERGAPRYGFGREFHRGRRYRGGGAAAKYAARYSAGAEGVALAEAVKHVRWYEQSQVRVSCQSRPLQRASGVTMRTLREARCRWVLKRGLSSSEAAVLDRFAEVFGPAQVSWLMTESWVLPPPAT